MISYNEAVVFNHYLDQSLKNKTRKKRQVESAKWCDIHPEMKLRMSQGVTIFIKNRTWFARIWSYVNDMQIYSLAGTQDSGLRQNLFNMNIYSIAIHQVYTSMSI